MRVHKFRARLFKYQGVSSWFFVEVPSKYSPPFKMGWGRTPVFAKIDGTELKTSVWTGKDKRILLPVSKKFRNNKTEGDYLSFEIRYLLSD